MRIDEALATGGEYRVEHRIVVGEGGVKHVQSLGVAELDGDGKPLRMAGTVQDVTDKVSKDIALREQEAMIRAMSEAAHDAMVMIDSEDTVLFWNSAAVRLLGYTSEEILGRKMHDLIALAEDAAKAQKGLEHFARTGTGPVMDTVMEFTAVKKSGETFPVERSVSAFQAGDQWYAVGSLRDITRRKEDEAKLTEMANIDGLTGLNNRRNFLDVSGLQFKQARRYGKPFSVVMFDVDHFKRVNDTYGHDIGDEVLKALSRTVEATCRDADVPGRLGGEEFAVALPETGLAEALLAAERIRAALAACRVDTPRGGIAFTVSLGVAAAGEWHEDLEALLKDADTALYKAKQGGRNRVEAAG
jgi:diguanylate cyclase (GGDEF)-like protein/PAS domain S-box-containing protein